MAAGQEYKTCSKCLQDKPSEDFYAYTTMTGKKSKRHVCKSCRDKQGDGLLRNKTARNKVRANKQKVIELFGGRCQKCGGQFHPVCLEFHHVDPQTKEKNPSVYLKYNFDKIKDKFDNCVMVCSNCHKLIHFEYEMEVKNAGG